MEPLADLIIQSCLDRREATSFQNRQYAVPLTVTLLTINPLDFSSMLFGAKATSDNSLDSKPTSYLFTKLLLIDIKATIPSLQEILNSAEFPATSIRMSGSYCIICTFMKFLMQMLDQADVSPISSSINNKLSDSVSFPPSLLLQLRADISETLSLTIEFLRDRFDASIAGAANLHPSASSGIEDARSPATIPFNSSSTIMGRDTLTLSQFCTLAIWLHEDDNKALRKEAAGIMDLLFHFYNPEDDKLDFRSPVLTALLGIFAIPEGVNAFFALDGWSILVNDLQSIFLTPSPELAPLGIEIVNVLLAVVESDVTGPAKEWWLDIVSLASVTRLVPEHMMLDLRVSIAQLALELLDRSPKRVMKRHMRDLRKLLDLSKKLLRGTIGEDTRERLEGIVVGLEVLADS